MKHLSVLGVEGTLVILEVRILNRRKLLIAEMSKPMPCAIVL